MKQDKDSFEKVEPKQPGTYSDKNDGFDPPETSKPPVVLPSKLEEINTTQPPNESPPEPPDRETPEQKPFDEEVTEVEPNPLGATEPHTEELEPTPAPDPSQESTQVDLAYQQDSLPDQTPGDDYMDTFEEAPPEESAPDTSEVVPPPAAEDTIVSAEETPTTEMELAPPPEAIDEEITMPEAEGTATEPAFEIPAASAAPETTSPAGSLED